MAQSFTQWLKQQAERDDPVGDLARDAVIDPTWPREDPAPLGGDSLSRYLGYFDQAGASDGARRALERAWQEWEGIGA